MAVSHPANDIIEDNNSLKFVQKAILEIFMVYRKICEQHHLRYWAIGGTCLGAVRHCGFIPWDDDLDVAMPDEDYQKFMEIAPKELPYPYELIPPGKLLHSPVPFMKIQNVETTFIEDHERTFPDSFKGIFIDIFPLCGMPNSKVDKWLLQKKIYIFGYLSRYSKRAVASMHGMLKKMLVIGSKCLSFPFPDNYFLMLWLKTIFKYKFNAEENKFTALLCIPGYGKNLVFNKEWFSSYVELPFEITTIRCPSGYDEFLTRQFGNYLEFPPEEQRSNIHQAFIDLNRPYTYYQRHGLSK